MPVILHNRHLQVTNRNQVTTTLFITQLIKHFFKLHGSGNVRLGIG